MTAAAKPGAAARPAPRSAAPAARASLPERILRGDALALARAMSLVESGAAEAESILDQVYGRKDAAPRIGFTGPPGAGKSTLVAEYTRLLRGRGRQVGVVAVDPTSPFTGGAILGDRVRMSEHATDAKVFIRSMATRGSLGGLAARTGELCELLSAWGSDVTLVETVGVGQSELDVAETADTTVVVLTPESGDAIQTLKAGLMEIADVLVLNKSDHSGADQMEAALRSSLAFRPPGGFKPPIVRTIATQREGLDALDEAVGSHRAWASSPEIAAERRRDKIRARLRHAVREGLLEEWLAGQGLDSLLDRAAERVLAGDQSPYRAARELIERMTRKG
ncbi:MAG TPA: methylmalonyl Co-A mutase-associated GTPase MeaB [Candidatus Eisenbacteria bacterium]